MQRAALAALVVTSLLATNANAAKQPSRTASGTAAGAGSISLTGTIGTGSPDTSVVTVGTQLTRLTCRNGILTGFVGT